MRRVLNSIMHEGMPLPAVSLAPTDALCVRRNVTLVRGHCAAGRREAVPGFADMREPGSMKAQPVLGRGRG